MNTASAAFAEPICDQADLLSILDRVEPVLPTLNYFSSALRQGAVQIHFVRDTDTNAEVFEHAPPRIQLPHGYTLFEKEDSFASFVKAAGAVAFRPAGLELPPVSPVGTYDQIRAGLWAYFSWTCATAASFVYQITHEMDEAGLLIQQWGSHESLLEPEMTRIFAAFRSGGLEAAAAFYRHVVHKPQEARYDLYFGILADRILQAGVDTSRPTAWEAPLKGITLHLAPTALDQRVEARLPYEDGPARFQGWHLTPLEGGQQETIRSLLDDGYIASPRALDLIRSLAENLAPELWFRLTSKDVPVQTKTIVTEDLEAIPEWTYHPSDIGLASSTARTIVLHKGMPVLDALRIYVLSHGMATMPLKLNQPVPHAAGQIVHHSEESLYRHLKLSFYRSLTWGYATLFEFIRQAGFRRIHIGLTESEESIKEQFDRAGLSLTFAYLRDNIEVSEQDAVFMRMREAAKAIIKAQSYHVYL